MKKKTSFYQKALSRNVPIKYDKLRIEFKIQTQLELKQNLTTLTNISIQRLND